MDPRPVLQTAAYFAQVGLKKDEESKDKTIGGTAVEGAKPLYEIVSDTGSGEVKHQRTNSQVAPTFPFHANLKARRCNASFGVCILAHQRYQPLLCQKLRQSNLGLLARQRID